MNTQKEIDSYLEKERISEIEKIGISALEAARVVHNSLGISGRERVQTNQFGEEALKADIACEQAVLEVLRHSGLSFIVNSEEHGLITIGRNPQLYALLDGIDGTESARPGTMFGIFSSTDPTYEKYLFSGIADHSRQEILTAVKGHGAFVRTADGMIRKLPSSEETELEEGRIYSYASLFPQFGLDGSRFEKALEKFSPTYINSTAAHYADLVSGRADVVIECTRKGNLELSAYGLVREVGGVICDEKGRDIGEQKYLEFGQQSSIPVLTAANYQLLQQLIQRVNSV